MSNIYKILDGNTVLDVIEADEFCVSNIDNSFYFCHLIHSLNPEFSPLAAHKMFLPVFCRRKGEVYY